jgi:hypothetical protein
MRRTWSGLVLLLSLLLSAPADAVGGRNVTVDAGAAITFSGSAIRCVVSLLNEHATTNKVMCYRKRHAQSNSNEGSEGSFVGILGNNLASFHILPVSDDLVESAHDDYADAIFAGKEYVDLVLKDGQRFTLARTGVACVYARQVVQSISELVVTCFAVRADGSPREGVAFGISDRAAYAIRYDARGRGSVEASFKHDVIAPPTTVSDVFAYFPTTKKPK